MLMRGLWALTWLELKIFLREPLGAIGTIVFPVLAFVILQRTAPRGIGASALPASGIFSEGGVPVFVSILIAISAVLSLVTIIAIYREGGILKRLRATPLRPPTILTAHVLVKLLLTAVTMTLMLVAGKRYFAGEQVVERGTKGVDIAPLVGRLGVHRLFVRHVVGRADALAM